MILEEDAYLEHFGVKGQKWGVRKSRGEHDSFFKKRAARKQKRFEENQKKAASFVDTALKDPNVLINLNGRTIVTGQEFINHMTSGGLLDIKTTKVYAQLNAAGTSYVLK